MVKVTIDSYVNLPANETQIQQWLFKHGPISIGVNAAVMQFYKFGVSHPYKVPLRLICNATNNLLFSGCANLKRLIMVFFWWVMVRKRLAGPRESSLTGSSRTVGADPGEER